MLGKNMHVSHALDKPNTVMRAGFLGPSSMEISCERVSQFRPVVCHINCITNDSGGSFLGRFHHGM